MKISIYTGHIPSSTFIERLINGIASDKIKVFIHGQIIKEETIFGEMIGHLSLTVIELSLVVILLIMKIFKEGYQEEIIIMLQNLLRNIII